MFHIFKRNFIRFSNYSTVSYFLNFDCNCFFISCNGSDYVAYTNGSFKNFFFITYFLELDLAYT